MLVWLTENIGTILITILLILIVTWAVLKIIKDKKQGKSSCGGSCAHCNMYTACKKEKH